MTILIILICSIPGFLLGRIIFKYFFNPITVYTLIWTSMLSFYSLKLISYDDLKTETWLYIAGAYFALLIGSLTFLEADKLFGRNKSDKTVLNNFHLFDDGGKVLKIAIFVFSVIGFISALQHWIVLIDKYGSIAGVLLNTAEVYQQRVDGEIEGVIPYIQTFNYLAIFLSAILIGYRDKFSFWIFLPFSALFLKNLAGAGRASLLLGIVMFIGIFFISKYFFNTCLNRKQLRIGRNIIIFVVVSAFFIGASVYMRAFRSTVESIGGTDRALAGFKENLIISPSIYLYSSAHVVVFDKYLQMDSEKSEFLQYTFQPIYNILAKFDIVEKTQFYHDGYYIPVWTNTGTYLREMHADYGIWGIILVPYLLGFFSTFLWFRFFSSGKIIYLILYNQIFAIIFFSFFLSPTRLGDWLISLILLLICIPLLEKWNIYKANKLIC